MQKIEINKKISIFQIQDRDLFTTLTVIFHLSSYSLRLTSPPGDHTGPGGPTEFYTGNWSILYALYSAQERSYLFPSKSYIACERACKMLQNYHEHLLNFAWKQIWALLCTVSLIELFLFYLDICQKKHF